MHPAAAAPVRPSTKVDLAAVLELAAARERRLIHGPLATDTSTPAAPLAAMNATAAPTAHHVPTYPITSDRAAWRAYLSRIFREPSLPPDADLFDVLESPIW